MNALRSDSLSSRLLVVDDEPSIRQILFKILNKHSSHTIDLAEDGQEAFEKWQAACSSEQSYDLMVVDLRMPRMDGETLIQEIRKHDSDIAVIVLTGHGQLNDAYMLLKEYQISDFLNKPLQSPVQLLFSVENALEKRQLRQKLQKYSKELEQEVEERNMEIEARKQAEEALQENRSALLALMSHSSGIVYRRQNDREWSMEFISEGAAELTGYELHDILEKPEYSYGNLINPADKEHVWDKIQEALQQQQSFQLVYRISTMTEEKWVLDKGNGNFSVDGELLNIGGFIMDITAQKQAEEQLKKLNSDKDKFFSIVSHDLRTPLIGLLGFSELLANRVEKYSSEKIKKSADNIHKSAKRLHNLLENMLHWARIQTGRVKHEPINIDLHQIANDNVQLFEGNAVGKNIRLVSEIGSGTEVYADKHMVDSVIRNLMSNAIKFTEQEGMVTVSTENQEKFVEISIADTGVGMEPGKVETLFRMDVPHTTVGTANEGGTGLGLMLCKEMVEKNGGQIWVESQQGQGTTFRFTLPKPI